MSLIEDLNWRYACKRMNGKILEQDKLEIILDAIRLAPTSMGMQIFKVSVITDPKVKNQIWEEAAPRQMMIKGCSHLLVFSAYTKLTQYDVNEYIDHLGAVRNITGDRLEEYRTKWSFLLGMSEQEIFEWSARQTYIVMAYASIAAATLRVDSTPVEGFNASIVDEILGLPEKNLRSTLLFPLGFRDSNEDHLADTPKVRKENKDLFIF